jgi:bifunctional non-homologous end joining protein LigD
MELEGIVSKERNGSYQPGLTDTSRKSTCRRRETFLVAGIAYRKGKFDGVYLACKVGRRLKYRGKVEHGFTDESARGAGRATGAFVAKRQPIEAGRKFPKATWVKPVLPVDVEYRALTGDGLMRHTSFKGVREDLL